MLWPLSVVLVANTNGRLAIPALAGLLVVLHARRSGMDHTVLPAITPMPAFS